MRLRGARNFLKIQLGRRLLEGAQYFGVNVTPHHFYSEIPDLRELRRSDHWRRPYSMRDVCAASSEEQIKMLRSWCAPIGKRLNDLSIYDRATVDNGAAEYGPIEALVLYAFVRSQRPLRVVQIGAGLATAVILRAAADAGYVVSLLCVDPHPNAYLRSLARDGAVELLAAKGECVPLSRLASLGEGGLLFIDSSHTLRPGGEVARVVLEVLPQLQPGSWVHFHDIYFPYDYAPGILRRELFFHHESVFLHAFLCGNSRFRVALSLSWLHHQAPQDLTEVIPSYRPRPMRDGVEREPSGHFPSATYLTVMR